jgi:hypothetical protein
MTCYATVSPASARSICLRQADWPNTDLNYCLLENGRTSPSGSNALMTLSLTGC